ncbi:hypothetical protein HMI56_004225, partial [Coelomomyces lativittatus]
PVPFPNVNRPTSPLESKFQFTSSSPSPLDQRGKRTVLQMQSTPSEPLQKRQKGSMTPSD